MRTLLLITFLLVVNCKLNKVVDSHGSNFLEKKEKELILNNSNKNDIILLLGPPSTKSKFDNDLWIYIESKKTRTTFAKLGKKKIYVNNVLLLEIDNRGILAKKELIKGKDLTPFLINEINILSKNETLKTNMELIINNALIAGKLASNFLKLI